MSKNSKQLWNERTQLDTRIKDAVAAGNNEEALRIEGMMSAIDAQIADVLEDEANDRASLAQNLINPEKLTFGEKLFGTKAEFKGIQPDFKASAPIADAVSGLDTPQIYKTDLHGPVVAPTGFLSTIRKGVTNGDEHFFTAPVFTNRAAGWTSGNKPESALKWTEATAPLQTIAHWIPIKKQVANRYDELDSIVRSSLLSGLDLKADELSIRGDNENGITGVTETTGILIHTKGENKSLKDTFQSMARKVRVGSGYAAGYVCLSPYAIEELSQEKDETGRYLYPDVANGGKIAGLTIVEDVNMTTAAGKETALVYYGGAASFDIADPKEVTVGLTNSQFIQNEYTVLAELTAALRVDIPAGFCYCADLGIDAEAVDSE